MKKLFAQVMLMVAVAGASMLAVPAIAQHEHRSPEERAKQMTDSLKSNLSLSDSQYAKVYQLNVDYLTRMQAMHQDSSSREQKMETVRELRQSQNKALNAVLTPDQWTKYQAMRKEQWKARKENHESKPSGS